MLPLEFLFTALDVLPNDQVEAIIARYLGTVGHNTVVVRVFQGTEALETDEIPYVSDTYTGSYEQELQNFRVVPEWKNEIAHEGKQFKVLVNALERGDAWWASKYIFVAEEVGAE